MASRVSVTCRIEADASFSSMYRNCLEFGDAKAIDQMHLRVYGKAAHSPESLCQRRLELAKPLGKDDLSAVYVAREVLIQVVASIIYFEHQNAVTPRPVQSQRYAGWNDALLASLKVNEEILRNKIAKMTVIPVFTPPPLDAAEMRQKETFYASCLEKSRGFELDEEIVYFSQKLALIKLEMGKYSDALDLVNSCLALPRAFDPYSVQARLQYVDVHILKGRVLGLLNEYSAAAGELLSVFQENCTLRGEMDVKTTHLFKYLGWILSQASESGEVIDPAALELLSVHLEEGKEGSLDLLFIGRRCYEKALLMNRKMLGEHHLDTAKSYSNVGWCYEKMGNIALARDCYQTAFSIYQQLLPPRHPDFEEARKVLERLRV